VPVCTKSSANTMKPAAKPFRMTTLDIKSFVSNHLQDPHPELSRMD
jgi:hypothetical protein